MSFINIFPESDAKTFAGFASIAYKNEGVWKSHAQRKFWFKCDNLKAVPNSEQHAAVGALEGDYVVRFDGTTRWASYGARSIIPVLIYVVYDYIGVRRIVHVGGHGNARDGWAPDFNAKAKVKFERAAGVTPLPTFPEQMDNPPPVSQAIGAIGDKVEIDGVLVYVKKSSFSVSYATSVSSYFHIIKDDAGNVYKYKGSTCLGDLGGRVSIRATVKAHEEGREPGSVVTVIKAPKMKGE